MNDETTDKMQELVLALVLKVAENATEEAFAEFIAEVGGECGVDDLLAALKTLELKEDSPANPFEEILDEIAKLANGTTHSSFDELLDALARLRPKNIVDGKAVFDYDGTPVLLQAGEMSDIHWMDIFVVVPGLRASQLEINQKLLDLNRETHNQPIPSWFAAGSRDEVLYVNRLDWQHISAITLDEHIAKLCKFDAMAITHSSANHATEENEKFEKLLSEMKARHVWENVDGRILFRYGDLTAYLVRGEKDEIHWVDIFVEVGAGRADRLDASKRLLQANAEMSSSTPIPSWFATGPHHEALFVNRLNWQQLSAEVLDDHIQRCVEQMGEALIADAASELQSQSHHSATFKDYRTEK